MTATSPIRAAEIIAVGSELLTPWRQDTNSLFITQQLNEIGIELLGKTVVGDDRAQIARSLRDAIRRVPLVVLTGGLGPTDDDLTREVAAAVLGRSLSEDAAIVDRIRRRFESRGWVMPEVNRRQAQVPEGADLLDNPRGTAPGLWIEHVDGIVVLLPGPPRELQPMLEALISSHLESRTTGERLCRRVVKVTGRPESDVEQAAQPAYARWRDRDPPVSTTILASPGQIELHLSVRAESTTTGATILDAAVAELVAALGDSVVSTDGRSLEEVVGDLLTAAGLRIAVAESCSGGLLLSRLTDVPGSSRYVESGVVSYSNASKSELLGVPASLIESHGAVSEPVAEALASGVRTRTGADLGVGITGIAGPGGGSPEKPVGSVAIAVDGPRADRRVASLRFPGGRQLVKRQTTEAALDVIRRALLAAQGPARGLGTL